MSEPTTEPTPTPATDPTPNAAEAIAKTMDTLGTSVTTLTETVTKTAEDNKTRFEALEKSIEEGSKVTYEFGLPNGTPAHGVQKGEFANTSRPYSLARLAVALMKRRHDPQGNWREYAKPEVDLGNELTSVYKGMSQNYSATISVPLSTDHMPEEFEITTGDKVEKVAGVPAELKKRCGQMMKHSMDGFDPDHATWIEKKTGLPIAKDLSANTATTGGTLVGFATQGQLIELLRAREVMARVGAQEIPLPPQGSIRYPRVTGAITISAFAEGATVTESTPATGALTLQAKKYSGLVDIPEELMQFATSVTVESWLRGEFVRDLALKTDRDMINGAGGTFIQGLINYSGVRLLVASTTGAAGDTLDPEDPILLFADIADQNAEVDRGFFYAMTNTLWGGLTTRKATGLEFVFSVGANQVGGGPISMSLNGHQVIGTTQVPTDRVKGAGTTLTPLIGGVGADWIIGRAGVVDISMTDSDASKFQAGIHTMRGTQYIDAGPRHEDSFGYIDDLLNA